MVIYVSEDRSSGSGRIIRIDSDGNHSVFATGFNYPQGLAFDPLNGDLFISEQGEQSVWRVTFTAVPEPSTFSLALLALLTLGFYASRRRRPA